MPDWSHADWERLGRAVKKRRQHLGPSQEKLVQLVNELVGEQVLSTATLRKVENAKQTSYDGRTLPSLCRGLKWEPDAWEQILNGADPDRLLSTDTVMPSPASDQDFVDLRALPQDVRQQILDMVAENQRKQQS